MNNKVKYVVELFIGYPIDTPNYLLGVFDNFEDAKKQCQSFNPILHDKETLKYANKDYILKTAKEEYEYLQNKYKDVNLDTIIKRVATNRKTCYYFVIHEVLYNQKLKNNLYLTNKKEKNEMEKRVAYYKYDLYFDEDLNLQYDFIENRNWRD